VFAFDRVRRRPCLAVGPSALGTPLRLGKRAVPRSLTLARRRSLLALLSKAPAVYGWCRTRWSGAALAETLRQRHGWQMSAETVRRWLHALDWRWKRAKLAAKDDDPERVSKLASIRLLWETLQARQVLLFADELDIALLPKPGYQWMQKGTQVEVMTPGRNEKRYLAGAWDVRTGQVHHHVWARKTNGLFRDLLETLATAYPARRFDRIYGVVDNYKIHKAQAVQRWLETHPRFELVFLPTYCPRAKSDHKGIGHSRHGCGGAGRMSFQGLCHFGLLVKLAELIRPRPILLEVPLHIRDQIASPLAPVVAGHFVVQIAEAAFDRIGTGAIGGQKQQHEARMLL
jgi:hypothetical protein